jgi:methionyl-tRNA formyltransferase
VGGVGGPVKVAFLGTPEAAVPSLEAIAGAGHRILLCVTQPDRPSGRSHRPAPPPVKRAATAAGVPVVQPERIRSDEFRTTLAALRPDALVVVAYGKILPRSLLEVAPRGGINLHFSLLPLYRGAAPVQWALARGERVTGVTTMFMNERLDEGDVLLQREVPIERDEHAPALEARLASIGAGVLVETLAALERGGLNARAQDHARASHAPLLYKRDG